MLSITVNTLLDDTTAGNGLTSLREALAAVTPQNSQILFDPSLTGGTIRLTAGELTVGASTQIVGPGASSLTIDAQRLSRVLTVNTGVLATVSGVTMTGGFAVAGDAGDGGGILNRGDLTLQSVVVAGNEASDEGGGVFSRSVLPTQTSSLRVIKSTIADNRGRYGAGLNVQIDGTGVFLVERSTVANNRLPTGSAACASAAFRPPRLQS